MRLLRITAAALLVIGGLSACRPGGTPPEPACHAGPDVETDGGPDLNGTIATAVTTAWGDIWSCNDHVATGDFTDVDTFRLPAVPAPTLATISCAPLAAQGTLVELRNAAGTLLAVPCLAGRPQPKLLALTGGPYYLLVHTTSATTDALVRIDAAAIVDPADPLALTLPGRATGTVGPGDPSDTITFTIDPTAVVVDQGCVPSVQFTIVAPGHTSTLVCGEGGSTTAVTGGGAVTITVSAPAGATGPVGYSLGISD